MAETQTEVLEQPSIDARQASKAAIDYYLGLYTDLTSNACVESNNQVSVSLEEVELSEDGKHWLITLGFKERVDRVGLPAAFALSTALNPYHNKYKVFKVDARTGKVVAMKMRSAE